MKGEEPPGFLQAAKGPMCSALPEKEPEALGRWSDGGSRFSAAEVVEGGERAEQPESTDSSVPSSPRPLGFILRFKTPQSHPQKQQQE